MKRALRFRIAGGKTTRDYRLVCSCQKHQSEVAILLRRLPSAGKRGGAAAILAASLGLGAVNMPAPVQRIVIAEERRAVAAPVTRVEKAAPRAAAMIEEVFFGREPRRSSLISEKVREDFFRYAMPYGQVIYEEARRNQLPPELVAAVINTESNFRPWLRSHKNAVGLMQLLPSTGRLMGADDLLDPIENVRAGTRYLRYLNRRFKGNTLMVLAAYNAGEGNIARFGGMPPFRETIQYIQRVTLTRDRLSRELARRIMSAEAGSPLPPSKFFRQPPHVYLASVDDEAPVAPREEEPSEVVAASEPELKALRGATELATAAATESTNAAPVAEASVLSAPTIESTPTVQPVATPPQAAETVAAQDGTAN